MVSSFIYNKISEDNNKLFVAGEENLDIQILEEEDLPDIDETDMIHGLDHTGRGIHTFTNKQPLDSMRFTVL